MSPTEKAATVVLRAVHGQWHACALGTKRNPIHEEDRARGLKEGDLCDDCEAAVKWRVAQFLDLIKEEK